MYVLEGAVRAKRLFEKIILKRSFAKTPAAANMPHLARQAMPVVAFLITPCKEQACKSHHTPVCALRKRPV